MNQKTWSKRKTSEDSKKYMKTIVAFSNSEGGRLIIGVNDDSEVVGVDPSLRLVTLQSGKLFMPVRALAAHR